ncbi:amino acid ABC transporter substrate-binding protein [Caulobacter sp. NIBR2454]|uniref:amino acid ABC transporter substrate-binding protein n=1 Tax=Caulobacter sp. NIBR2454 TaxID=3015996 RepID=UPI0022B66E64|nr:amino acid ABC transporter substrate-binding protein [Caulobacter sp. NIBR2454]
MSNRVVVASVLLALAVGACGERAAQAPAPAPGKELPVSSDRAAQSETLRAVVARGRLNCGVDQGLSGFSFRDNRGVWRGFSIDLCRAVAAAALGDADAVNFVPVTAENRIEMLRDGKIDLLARSTSWTFSRDAGEGVDFAGIAYYDGQGFLARKALNLQSALELNGARVCVQSGSTSQNNLTDYFRANGLTFTAVPAASNEKAREIYQTEGCDVLSADISALASARSVASNPGQHVILPDVISKEPLALAVRQNDPAWTDLVRWTLNALILGEELGVTSKNVGEMAENSTAPEVRRLLGVEAGYGGKIGLDDAFAFRAIQAVGNYSEIFERNVGAGSPLRLERGLNALWNAPRPGLLYAPPFR